MRGDRVRRILTALLSVVALGFSTFSALAFFGAINAWVEAERWIATATYQAKCTPGRPSEGSAGCEALRGQAPAWPDNVPVTDPDLLLSLSSLAQSTGSAVSSLAGLSLAVSALLVSVIRVVQSDEADPCRE